ncbi:MAG: hypothetical protein NW214_15370 [Pseudanabaenaceae cyanobacterium bins.39]|nr:hypothetical protein [Pseudanabaenaceae cyanobacterium bins.39]
MALKVGKLEIGWRLFISLSAIAIAYGFIGAQLVNLTRFHDYWIAGLILIVSILAAIAIPQSIGGLLGAIAVIFTVYLRSDLNNSLITTGVCLALYILSFADFSYEANTDQKLSIWEIIATVVTIAFTVSAAMLVLRQPVTWVQSGAVGVIAAAITLVGKQFLDTGLTPKAIAKIFAIVTGSSLAIGIIYRIIFYLIFYKPESYY